MITINYKDKDYKFPKYTTIEEFFIKEDPEILKSQTYEENPVVAALANAEIVPLSAKFNYNLKLEPVFLFTKDGTHMYRKSITFLFVYTVYLLFPNRHIIFGHSFGDGYYFYFRDGKPVTQKEQQELTEKMQDLCRQALPIYRNFISYDDCLKSFQARGCEDTAAILEYSNKPKLECYRINDYLDLCSEVLCPNTKYLTKWEIRSYANGVLLRFPRSFDFFNLQPFSDKPKLFSVFEEYRTWGEILGVQCIGQLDKLCYDREKIVNYIRLSESLQARKIASIADEIVARPTKAVLIAGPSSSGKTTFAKKLCIQLQMHGKDAKRISLDDYYNHPSLAPKGPDGQPDLEAFEALDYELFRQNLRDLFAGKSINLPSYDFKTALRSYAEKPYCMQKNTILVIEGIHALNPDLLEKTDPNFVYKIYISALTQINLDDHTRLSTSDNRLLRRMVRDCRVRGSSALRTLSMWASVQRGENIHIFPFQDEANIILNSALDYEISVLASFAVPLLKSVKPSSGIHYTKARRLLKILDHVYPLPDSIVPEDSLIREFIGGSVLGD